MNDVKLFIAREVAATMNDGNCSICLQECAESDIHTLECGHVFHCSCIVQWFRAGSSTCPMCRSDPEVALQVMGTCGVHERAERMWRIGNRDNAPTPLKRLVARVRQRKSSLKVLLLRAKEHKRIHKDTFVEQRTLSLRVQRTRRALRGLRQELGLYVDDNMRLPAILNFSVRSMYDEDS